MMMHPSFTACSHLLVVLSILTQQGAGQDDGQGSFRPVTYGINFKAHFRVQAFTGDKLIYSGDISESYHSQLGTGLIKQTSHLPGEGENSTARETSSKFQYDNRSRRWYEFARDATQDSGSGNDGSELSYESNDFYLYENGGSSSYRADKLQRDIAFSSIWPVDLGAYFDSKLLTGDHDNAETPSLNLDHFMRDECLDYLRQHLHYVAGLTRLLHLIECRRGEFKLQQSQQQQIASSTGGQGGAQLTRGQSRQLYRAEKLESSSRTGAVKNLDLLVALHQTKSQGATLASGAIPLSIMLEFAAPKTIVLVNLYQFESVGAAEHLSESAGGHSIYLMPLAQPNLAPLLAAKQHEQRPPPQAQEQQWPARSFSFEALLVGSHLDKFYRDPVELLVSYDARLGVLATKTSVVDRSQSDALSGWKRLVTRQLHDGQSGLKFHLMNSNYGYVESEEEEQQQQRADSQQRPKWRACATDKLASSELAALLDGSEGEQLFNLAGATYMGEALVRGIQCQVYERRLFSLPALLGMSDQDHMHSSDHLASSELYLNMYAHGPGALVDAAQETAEVSPSFARLDFRFVSKLDKSQRRSLTLELSSFVWAPVGITQRDLHTGEESLTHLAQECLLSVPGARHLDMELWFGLADQGNSSSGSSEQKLKLLGELANDSETRDESVRELLASSALGISLMQQVDLESEMLLETSGAHQLSGADFKFSPGAGAAASDHFMYAKFSVYELWADAVQETFVGHARSLTLGAKLNLASPSLGARALSYAECRWRAVHSLQPDRAKSEYGRKDDGATSAGDQRDSRLFMFCPQRLICILGDTSWLPMKRQRPLKLENLLEFPYEAPANSGAGASAQEASGETTQESPADRCLIGHALIRQQFSSARQDKLNEAAAGMSSSGPRLNWWLINGSSGLGRSSDSLAQQKVRELSLELKVRGAWSGANTTLAGDDGRASSLQVRVTKLKVSNRIFVAPSERAATAVIVANESSSSDAWTDVSLLIKPLVGVAYLSAQLTSNSSPGDSELQQQTMQAFSGLVATRPLVAASLAECSRSCLLQHECQSFSACHIEPQAQQQRQRGAAPGARVRCVLSRLSWSSERDFHQLARLATLSQENKNYTLALEEAAKFYAASSGSNDNRSQLTPGTAEVRFERSRLCSLRARPQLDLYRMVQAPLGYQPAAKLLAPAGSLEQCARLCQERAQLMRELALARGDGSSPAQNSETPKGLGVEPRTHACHEFRFSYEKSYCQLLPLRNHWATLGLERLLSESPPGNTTSEQAKQDLSALPTLSRWSRWFSEGARHAEWLEQLGGVQALGEADHYELDWEHIFIAQRNRRLVWRAGERAKQTTDAADPDEIWIDGSQPQVRLPYYSLNACAKKCLTLKWCRSFDAKLPVATRSGSDSWSHARSVQQRASLCLLNIISIADLEESGERNSSADWPSRFELEQQASASEPTDPGEWWHYEPSELALFIITDPSEATFSAAAA